MSEQAILHHIERTLVTVRTVRTYFESITPPPVQTSVTAAFHAQALQRYGLIEQLHLRLRAQLVSELTGVFARPQGHLPYVDGGQHEYER